MNDFFSMGGYGFYIWGSYLVTAIFMMVELVLVMRRRRTLLQRLGRMLRSNVNRGQS